MIRLPLFTAFAATIFVTTAYSQAKNVILFIGDGAGVSSLNAASIYGYGKPRSLYMQSMPHLALADTSTAREWVTDGAACASAWATGMKTRNRVVSMSADAEPDVKDGQIYKTIFEYAQELGLSTGVISNDHPGLVAGLVAPFYAHQNNRNQLGEIFLQLINGKYGKGTDLAIGAGCKMVSAAVEKTGHNAAAEAKAKGYAYVETMQELAALPSTKSRLIAMLDDEDFDFTEAVQQAVARLSQNPRGFILVAHMESHTGNTRTSLERVIKLDNAMRAVSEPNKSNTLLLFTADHGYDLRLKGEHSSDALWSANPKNLPWSVSLEDEHTGEEVPLLGVGPGSERIGGYMSNTDVFRVIMANYGWVSEAGSR